MSEFAPMARGYIDIVLTSWWVMLLWCGDETNSDNPQNSNINNLFSGADYDVICLILSAGASYIEVCSIDCNMRSKMQTNTHNLKQKKQTMQIYSSSKLAFPYQESLHPAPHRRPSPAGSSAWCWAAVDSADSFSRPVGDLWLPRQGNRVGHSLARCTGRVAEFCLTPTDQRVASAAPGLLTSTPGPADGKPWQNPPQKKTFLLKSLECYNLRVLVVFTHPGKPEKRSIHFPVAENKCKIRTWHGLERVKLIFFSSRICTCLICHI